MTRKNDEEEKKLDDEEKKLEDEAQKGEIDKDQLQREKEPAGEERSQLKQQKQDLKELAQKLQGGPTGDEGRQGRRGSPKVARRPATRWPSWTASGEQKQLCPGHAASAADEEGAVAGAGQAAGRRTASRAIRAATRASRATSLSGPEPGRAGVRRRAPSRPTPRPARRSTRSIPTRTTRPALAGRRSRPGAARPLQGPRKPAEMTDEIRRAAGRGGGQRARTADRQGDGRDGPRLLRETAAAGQARRQETGAAEVRGSIFLAVVEA